MKPILRIPALIVTLWVIGAASLAAQSNDHIDELLLQAKARLDSTTYIVLTAGGLIEESATPAQALEKAKSLAIVSPELSAESLVPVQDLSFLLMKSIGLSGGLFYSLFPGPRYAYRELVFSKAVNGQGGPLRTVAGDEVMRTLAAALALKGKAL